MQSPLLALSSLARWQLRSTGGNERKADISVNKMSMVSFCTLIVIKVQLLTEIVTKRTPCKKIGKSGTAVTIFVGD